MAGLQMKYFVLKPHGDDAYAKASRAAMRAYANHIAEENPDLRDELREWADRETPDLHSEQAPNVPHEGPARASCAGPLDAVVGRRR